MLALPMLRLLRVPSPHLVLAIAEAMTDMPGLVKHPRSVVTLLFLRTDETEETILNELFLGVEATSAQMPLRGVSPLITW